MRRVGRALTVLVAGFHAGLLGRRLAQAEADPAVILRWCGALLLLGVAFWLRRRGLSLRWGRSALVFWLLVLLLHAGAAPSTPSLGWLVVPAFALGMVLASRRGPCPPRFNPSPAVGAAVNRLPRRDLLLASLLSPRPPPARPGLRRA